MEEIIDDGLGDYYKAEKSLVADILDEKLNYIEARKRYKIMSEYIPINIFMNSFYLDSLMKLHYGDDPNWQNSKTYTIEIGSISYDEAVESIKKLKPGIGKYDLTDDVDWYPYQSDVIKEEIDIEVLKQLKNTISYERNNKKNNG